MKWDNNTQQIFEWTKEISNRNDKEIIANKIASKVSDGDIIGFGSGSTSYLAILAIAKRIKKENLKILAIPTSYEIEILCNNLEIPTTTLNNVKPNWGFDGADEVSPENWLIKGRGGAMFREKLLMISSAITYILVDNSKFVSKICEKFPIPVECNPESLNLVRDKLIDLGALSVVLRQAEGKDGPIITEYGNLILDVIFIEINETLEKDIKAIPGVLESGLFQDYNIEVIK